MHLVLILLKKQQIKKKKNYNHFQEQAKKKKRPSRPVQLINYLQSQIPCTHFSTTLSVYLFFFCVIRPGIRSGNFSHIIKTGLENMFYH